MTLKQAERALTAEYLHRQRRYAHSSIGHGCFNEQAMADRITMLENLVDELGGDCRKCLLAARSKS